MKKTSIWKRFVLIDGLIVISIVAAYAWFIMGDIASVDSMTEQVVDAGYIKISADGGQTWENGLDIDLGTVGIVREMSGNGLELYEPIYGIDDIEGYELNDSDKTDSDMYYIEEVFTFESDLTQDIFLSEESFLRPSDPTGNLSDMGDFSRDYIAGAIRVAFFEIADDGATYNPLYVWAPNSMIEYTGSSVNSEGSVEESYSYQIGIGVDDVEIVPTGGEENGVSEDGGFVWGSPEQAGVKPLLSFSTENNSPVTKTIMMRVWLEGSDRECVKALQNGRFKMYFRFDTSGKE